MSVMGPGSMSRRGALGPPSPRRSPRVIIFVSRWSAWSKTCEQPACEVCWQLRSSSESFSCARPACGPRTCACAWSASVPCPCASALPRPSRRRGTSQRSYACASRPPSVRRRTASAKSSSAWSFSWRSTSSGRWSSSAPTSSFSALSPWSPPFHAQDAIRFRRRRSRSLMPPHTPYRSSRRSA